MAPVSNDGEGCVKRTAPLAIDRRDG